MDSSQVPDKAAWPPGNDLAWGAVGVCTLAAILYLAFSLPWGILPIAVALYALQAACIRWRWPKYRDFGWANRITLARSVLVIVLMAWAPLLGTAEMPALWAYALISLLALILDGVDGKVARATGTETDFGARFDMELDALFILGLCIGVLALGKTGVWVLALGLMRYGFVAAGYRARWLAAPLPESFRRKTVCVWQIVTLMIAALPLVSDGFAQFTLGLALALLAWSFLIDASWLFKRRHSYATESL